ncbi:hypothetical protein O7599_09600 [Streptomyces sp. WMMC500]|uniref:hypothetical protein n=1 Tax=Streptomyces sp. WMMC500 TaxID=3015154 RepID=UPI00248B3CA6|nr:hypothetical protein [Streptomyces sp. WMMC500]WBB62762.1 hypothetical protein O7599_09600 [Streptomyces sp. WMMC500]
MLSLRLARGSHPLVLLRRLLVVCASAGVGFLLLAALGHASPEQLLWCAAPLAATVHFAVAVARTDPHAKPSPGLSSAGFGPAAAPVVAAVTTAVSCLLGSALALLFFLHLRGELAGLPFDGAAAALLGAGGPLPVVGALTLLACVPALAAAASAVSLRPRRTAARYSAAAAARLRARREAADAAGADDAGMTAPRPVGAATDDPPIPADLPWGTALATTGLALGAYAGSFAGAGDAAELKLPLPGGSGVAPPAVVASWVLIAAGLILAGPGVVHVCGRLLCALHPGALRLLAGRVLQQEAGRVGRPLGALCAVAAGGVLCTLVWPDGDDARSLGPLTVLGAALVVGCALATVCMAALESKRARTHTTTALLRLGASPRLLRRAALLRTTALLAAFTPLAAALGELASLPLR